MRIKNSPAREFLLSLGLAIAMTTSATAAPYEEQLLPIGQLLTPTAAPASKFVILNPGLPDNPSFVAGQPISEALSPDRNTLLVLTSGYNYQSDNLGHLIPADSNEYVFVFDVSSGSTVKKKQVLKVPNTYVGLAFAPSGKRFVVSGGGDDALHVFDLVGTTWMENAKSPISLGHMRAPTPTDPVDLGGIGRLQGPMAQGVAVSADGNRAVVANRYNASITVVDLIGGPKLSDIDLRPGTAGTPGGEYPDAVSIVGNQTAYVSSERDREIVVVNLTNATVIKRIAVNGNPNKMILNRNQSRLFVAVDNADVVAVIDTASNTVVDTIPTVAPEGVLRLAKQYRGASPNGLALSPDEQTLYVTNRGTNSLAVVAYDRGGWRVTGLIPTGWYPSDVAVGARDMLYVVNLQSVPGPNPGNCLGYQTVPCPVAGTPVVFAPNEYILNLSKGGLLSMPAPHREKLEQLTERVAENNHFDEVNRESEVMDALRGKIKHVIYIIKENRTYDQVLGDIGRGNSDPTLAEFPYGTTPNLHNLANQFVLLDNFYDPGNVSGNGWPWSTSGRESDASAKMLPVNYAGRGGSYDWEGTNSNINVGLNGLARLAANPLTAYAPNALPGTGNVAAPDGPSGEVQQGYLWNAALRKGLTVRNYGCLIDLARYNPAAGPYYITNTVADPHGANLTVAYAANPDLAAPTDGYFRGFDPSFPDTYREQEWAREFAGYVKTGDLPALSLVRLMEDHTGAFGNNVAGVNTPEQQVADNDFAVGRLVEAVAHSLYARDTLIFIVEDDAQDGPDHVDAHRSTAYVVGPYVKQGALVRQHYTTVNVLRTITDVLGLDHFSLFDATQPPMSHVFDLSQSTWTYTAVVSGLLAGTGLPIQGIPVAGNARKPTHDANYWARRTRDMDFEAEDRVDAVDYNHVLWQGLMGKRPYPTVRSGKDLTAQNERSASAARSPATGNERTDGG